MEEETKKMVWKGKIPVCFSLAEDSSGMGGVGMDRAAPEPCYMLVSRVSYFPLVYDKLERLYARAADYQPGTQDEIWLSSEEIPLKWHLPVGVLFDLFGRGGSLPWNVTVHFKNLPEDEVLRHGKEAVEAHFKSKFKEADCLKHRSEMTQTLTPQEFGQLWESVKSDKFDDFWSINKKMMLNARSEPEPFKSIPFAVYREGSPIYQRLINSVDKDGKELTLEDLIKLYSKDCNMPSDHTALIHGIELSPESPLQWLSEHFSYPDNFLHICVVPRLDNKD